VSEPESDNFSNIFESLPERRRIFDFESGFCGKLKQRFVTPTMMSAFPAFAKARNSWSSVDIASVVQYAGFADRHRY
jgi:hypothetical protein